MCLAVPMRVISISDTDSLFGAKTVMVEAGGIRQEVRLDIVDVPPRIGDYVIVHAGFAIRTLPPEEAKENLRLISEMTGVTIV